MTPECRKMLWGPLSGNSQIFQRGSRPPGFEKTGCAQYPTFEGLRSMNKDFVSWSSDPATSVDDAATNTS